MFCAVTLSAQSKIPESIKSDLTLKPQAKPYESTGFVVEKGATLTIMPGTKIKMSIKAGEKVNFPIVDINGTLKVGAKGTAKSTPVVFEGSEPMFRFNDAVLEINGMEVNNYCIRFFGDNSGYVNNCSFIRTVDHNSNYDFVFTVPKKGNLSFNNCLIENQGIDLKSSDFPSDVPNLTITNCAFTTKINKYNGKKLAQHFVPINLFAYGTKCDFYLDIEFKAFDWEFKKPHATEWYFGDERIRKTIEESVKPNKTFSMKFPTKAFTTYKQVEVPAEKDKDKDKK